MPGGFTGVASDVNGWACAVRPLLLSIPWPCLCVQGFGIECQGGRIERDEVQSCNVGMKGILDLGWAGFGASDGLGVVVCDSQVGCVLSEWLVCMGGDTFCFDRKSELEWIPTWSSDVELCAVLRHLFGTTSAPLSSIPTIWLGDSLTSEILLGSVCAIDGSGVSCGRSRNNGGRAIK